MKNWGWRSEHEERVSGVRDQGSDEAKLTADAPDLSGLLDCTLAQPPKKHLDICLRHAILVLLSSNEVASG
jgi:hypothetical protein